jgi:RNA polymerase sigma-70 factor, ECF subfamily
MTQVGQNPQPTRDPDVFLRLLMANQQRLYAFILTLLPNWADADDVFQEATTVLWRKFPEFTPGTNFLAWSCTVARFEVLRFRKRRQAPCLELDAELTDSLALASQTANLQSPRRLDALQQCIAKLSDADQHIVELRYQPGATIKGVAGHIGRPVQGLYKAMARIHLSLAECVRRTLAQGEAS